MVWAMELLELFFVVVSFGLGVAALTGSAVAWRLESHPIDFAMRILAAVWMLYLLVSVAQVFAAGQLSFLAPLLVYVRNVVFECLLASLAFFLATAAGAVRPWVLSVVALQWVSGLVAASWLHWNALASPIVRWGAVALSLLSAAVVTGSVMRQVRHTHSRRSWLVLAACALAIGLWLYQAATQVNTHSVLPVGLHLCAFFIFVVWKLISLSADADKALPNANTSFSGISHFLSPSSVNSDDEFISLAVRGERQRISYELHDNVGSQIVSILFAMQAAEQPQKRFVMLSLEQCLMDLKMMVDALDSFEENVTQALGRLRYRVQPALDRHRIQMRWDVQVSDELEAVRGIRAQQVLRIAQEGIANVMRHSRASSVSVTCRFVPEFHHLLLHICDDGVGLKPDEGNPNSAKAGYAGHKGHGLAGMARRAVAVGGHLVVSNRSTGGTCVRLTLPLAYLKPKQKAVDAAGVSATAQDRPEPFKSFA